MTKRKLREELELSEARYQKQVAKSDLTILSLEDRIHELENIICPGEQHNYKNVQEHRVFSNGVHVRSEIRQVCKRCYRVHEFVTDVIHTDADKSDVSVVSQGED